VMRAQLERLAEANGQPRVNIQVIPFAAEEYGSMGSSFSILNFSTPDPGVVYLEYRSGSLYLDGDQVIEYTHLWAHLTAVALGQRASTAVLRRVLAE